MAKTRPCSLMVLPYSPFLNLDYVASIDMSYFITIRNTNKEFLLEDGPFEAISDTMDFLIRKGYFLPPERSNANSYATIDEKGIAHLFISKSTAGFPYLSKEIKSISIYRDDFFTALSKDFEGSSTTH